MTRPDGLTSQQRRHSRTRERLLAALLRLSADPVSPLTAAALAREAGVGRNVLYVGHVDILDELRILAARRSATLDGPRRDEDADREKIRDLEGQLCKLATENAGLLRRAQDTEARLQLSEQRNAQLLRQLSELRGLAPVRTTPPGGMG